ncbi:MAG: glycosyltransferase family 9 protein, partial [Acidimicrobiaceae bacterium]|nr:glycosyltransferase family 9 protein [Acidimicrobiaceae bacterium]
RMDSLGDVLLSGPLVRAVAAGGERVTYLASGAGAPAARILPGVDRVEVDRAGWIEWDPPPVTRTGVEGLVERVRRLEIDVALVLTSFHQSPLPMAMVLRMAGVPRIGAISVDYPGSLLDIRHRVDDDIHEVVRSLSLGKAMGYQLPVGDDGSLQVELPDTAGVHAETPGGDYVVVHPGASAAARAWRADGHAEVVEQLARAGWKVVVTGGPDERALTAQVAGRRGIDLGGLLDLPDLARVVGGASAIVVGNTGPAHLAAAVSTPVVSLYAPTVPACRWRPWRVPHILLGDQAIACAGCRARRCPVPGHPCLAGVEAPDVVRAVERLAEGSPSPLSADGALIGGGS